MTNTEEIRQFYLASAGVRMWYAKRPLPGAAPSPEYHLEVAEADEGQNVHSEAPAASQTLAIPQPSQQKPRQRSVDLQALMSPGPAETGAEASEQSVSPGAEIASPEAELPASDSVVMAQLSIWRTENLLLVSQWSSDASERLQDSLARNLFLALGQQELLGQRQLLQWPVFRNSRIPGNSMNDFKDLLAGLASSAEGGSIILLGVLGDQSEAQRQYCLAPLLPRVKIDFPYSLAELSAAAERKRDLWQVLKSSYSM